MTFAASGSVVTQSGTPRHWMPPPAPLRRTRKHREAEQVFFLSGAI